MQVSKTLDYAVRSLSYMASSKDENITIKLVSEKQHIPHSYLAKIMRKLVQRGILYHHLDRMVDIFLREIQNLYLLEKYMKLLRAICN